MTTIIRSGRVLDSARMELSRADILIEDDRISAVGPEISVPDDARVIDASHHIVLPGLINAHTHADNNLTRGSGDNWTLEDLINHGSASLVGRSPEEHYLSAAIGAIEMLKSGCTAAYDMFFGFPAPTSESIEAIVRAYADVGLRAVLAPGISDIVFYRTVPDLVDLLPSDLRTVVEGIEAAPTKGLLEITEEAIRRWDGFASGRIRAAVAPTIPGQSTDSLLEGCIRLSREYGVGLHTHLAETKVQAIHAQRRWGQTIVDHLADIGGIGPRFLGAHGVWLTHGDIAKLAFHDASVVHNPASNLKLGSGIAPVREMLNGGLNVALGSDGSRSSDNQNMFESMRFAASVSHVRYPHDTQNWIGANTAWTMATAGSARALGVADDIGAIAPGRKADIVLLNSNSIYLKPMTNFFNAVVYTETGASVDTVMIDGRIVLEQGTVLTVDEASILSAAHAAVEKIAHADNDMKHIAAVLDPYVGAACRAAVTKPFPVNRYASAQ